MMSENKAEQRKVSASREDNAAYMNKVLPVQESFDVILLFYRRIYQG